MKIYFNDLLVEKNRIIDDQWVKGNSGNKLEVYFEDNILESSAVNVRAVIEWADGSTTNELVLNKSIKRDFAYLNLPILKTDGEVKFTLKIYSNDSLQQTTLFSRKVYNSINASDEIHITSSEYESLLETIESAGVDVDVQVKENTDNIELLLEAYEKGGLKYFDKVFAEDEIINLFNINGDGKYSIKSALYGDEIVIVNVENQYVSRFNGNATLTYDFEKDEWVKQTGSIESEGNNDFELIKNKIARWESLENGNQYPSASLVKNGLDSKLDKEQGNDNAYKVAVTNRFGNVYFENKLPKVNMPEIEADDLPEIPKDKLPQITVDMLPSGAGIIAEIAEELRADGGNITGNDIKNKLQTLDDMAAIVECKHAIEITGNTGDEHNLAVEDQQMLLNKIQGQSLVVNQLIDTSAFTTKTVNGVTFTNNNDGSISVKGTATANTSVSIVTAQTIKGRKYLGKSYINGSFVRNTYINFVQYTYQNEQGTYIGAQEKGKGIIFTVGNTSTPAHYIYVSNGETVDATITMQLIDLTLMFGAGNEPKTVEEFYSRYNQGHIPYNEGTFKHSKCNLISTGRNLWDEEWFSGYYTANGSKVESNESIYIATKNYIPALPNTQYSSNKMYYWCFFDEDKNFINRVTGATITTPNNCYYLTCTAIDNYGNTYKNDIIINSGSTPLEYEPYKEEVFVVNEELKAFDYIEDDKKIVASKEIVVDTNSIIEVTGYGYQNITYFKIDKPLDFVGRGNTGGNVICSKYQLGIGGNWDDANKIGLLFLTADHYNFWIGFPKGTTLEQAKAELNGVKLIYELATPTFTDLDIAGGYAIYKGGYQIQDGEVPYVLTKEYSMSLKAQVLANIEIDREQQEQLNELKEEINETLVKVEINEHKIDTQNQYIEDTFAKKADITNQNEYGVHNVILPNSNHIEIILANYKYWKGIIANTKGERVFVNGKKLNDEGDKVNFNDYLKNGSTLEYINGCLLVKREDDSYIEHIMSSETDLKLHRIFIVYDGTTGGQDDGFSIYWKGERT